jgi:hypothetical protein
VEYMTVGLHSLVGSEKKFFIAKNTPQEKIYRIFHAALCCAFLYNIYKFRAPKSTYVTCASYLVNALVIRKIVGTAIQHVAYPKTFETVFSPKAYCGPGISGFDDEESKKVITSFFTLPSSTPKFDEWEEEVDGTTSESKSSHKPKGDEHWDAQWKAADGHDAKFEVELERMRDCGYNVEKITLYKSGIAYEAIAVSHDNLKKTDWAIHARGNMQSMQDGIKNDAYNNACKYRCNTLFVNGPSVGKSRGWATRFNSGAGFEAGLQYLEKSATRIIMEGYSLGGGMMSEAILQHDFTEGIDKGIHYLAISNRTFDTLSHIIGAIFIEIVKQLTKERVLISEKIGHGICKITGVELDGVGAAEKLSKLATDHPQCGFNHIVVQHWPNGSPKELTENDDVIPDKTSLRASLKNAPNRTFIMSSGISHCYSLDDNEQKRLDDAKKAFIQAK